jgi:hypothetical protein
MPMHSPPEQSHLVQPASRNDTVHINRSISTVSEFLELTPGYNITPGEGDRLLHLYREAYSPLFPFVPLPSSTTASELYSTRPVLFKAIMYAVAPQNYSTQQEISLMFRRYIAEHVIMEQEKRLDILQALLIHIAW